MEAGSCSARLRRERRPPNQVGHIGRTSVGFGAWTSVPPSASPSSTVTSPCSSALLLVALPGVIFYESPSFIRICCLMSRL